MIRLTLIISMILLFQIFNFGQDVCVKIKTEEEIRPDDDFTLTADINASLTNQSLKFIWELSNGVKQITGKPIAVISTTKDDSGKEIKVNLEVDGLPPNCLKVDQSVIRIQRIIPRIHPPTFPNDLIWKNEKYWLSNVVDEVKLKETSVIYILISTKSPKSKKLLQRKQRMINFLTKSQKINKERVQIIVVDSEFEETRYWIVSKEGQPSVN